MSQGATTQSKPSALSVFKNRNFSLMWFGQLISEFGSGITSIAASILVYRLTGSAMSVGLMLMATALPGLVFGLIAGVAADRYDRKRILIISELVRAVLIALIPTLLPYSIVWLYIIVMLSSTISQFYNPAHASILPDIASEDELAAANSMLSISSIGALGLGFAAAGFITSQTNANVAFYIDAITFVLSAGLIFFVVVPPLKQQEEFDGLSVLINLREGAQFLWNSPILRSMAMLIVPMTLLFGLHNSLLLPFASTALGASEFEYSLIEGIGMVGFVVGALVMARIADRLREGQWMVISLIAMGVITMMYSQVQSVNIAIVLSVAVVFFNVPVFIARQLVVQRNTTREIRGRVSSVFFMLRDLMFMIGMGMAGLADVFDIRLLILIEGALITGTGMLAMVLPGLGRPAAEWKRALHFISTAQEKVELEAGHPLMLADLNQYAQQVPLLAELSLQDKQKLITELRYSTVEPGTMIVKAGEISDLSYVILDGRVVVGKEEQGTPRIYEILNTGDFFGEIAALTGLPRTANVIADESTKLLSIPGKTLREMASQPNIHRALYSTMMKRMVTINAIDMPRVTNYDQDALREMRTSTSEIPIVVVNA